MERWYRATGVATRLVVRALDVRLHYAGLEHVPTSGPVVIASTHVSYPDFIWIGLAAHERGRWVRFLTRHDVWNGRARRPMTAMRHIPVDREAPAAAYLTARRLLREGEAVGMFPEAGISYAYAVRSLMRGAAALARETGAPLVPLALWGTQRIWSVDPRSPGEVARPSLTRHRRVDLAFGPALSVAPDEDLTEATVRLGHGDDRAARGPAADARARAGAGRARPVVPRPPRRARPGPSRGAGLDSVPKSAVPPSWGPPIVSA